MLTLYRRHKASCPQFPEGRNSHNRCKCMIWADGVLGGKETRQSVKTRDWTKANKTVQQWEAQEKIIEGPVAVTLADAWTALLADLKTRVSHETIRKYKTLESQMAAWGTERGLTLLSQFDLDTLSQFRQRGKMARARQARSSNGCALSSVSRLIGNGSRPIPRRESNFRKSPFVPRCRSRMTIWSKFSRLAMAYRFLRSQTQD